jgi:hypothetical protein
VWFVSTCFSQYDEIVAITNQLCGMLEESACFLDLAGHIGCIIALLLWLWKFAVWWNEQGIVAMGCDICIGLWLYFHDSSPDFTEWFPNGYLFTKKFQGLFLTNKPQKAGITSFEVNYQQKWNALQNLFAKLHGLVKQSECWVLTQIKLLAALLFQLWELWSKCRHGHNIATIQRGSTWPNTSRNLFSLYLLQPRVLQEQQIFCNSVRGWTSDQDSSTTELLDSAESLADFAQCLGG